MDAPPSSDAPPAAVEPADDLEPKAIAAERLIFFADAVVAIAITLLALDLRLPDKPTKTNADVLDQLWDTRETYIAFLISFYVIAVYWSNHHKLFRYVTRLGGRLVLFSMGWLLMLVMTPFATRVLAGDGGFQVRFGLYAGVQGLALIFYVLMVVEIQRNKLYRPDMPREIFGNAYFGSGAMAVAFLASIPVALYTNYAYDVWIAVPVLTGVVRRLFQRRAARKGAPRETAVSRPAT
jgi:uncharacterized membrane protein